MWFFFLVTRSLTIRLATESSTVTLPARVLTGKLSGLCERIERGRKRRPIEPASPDRLRRLAGRLQFPVAR
jgi:hypothetical protein